MGEVYRARDARLGREVAIKVLPAELAADASRLKRFEKEAQSASALNHPNIVTIYDIGTVDSLAYIAMERVEGETLRKLLVSGPVATKKLLAIGAQVAEGLAKAHEAGIVHRDLKPENVMVTKDGLVKILDFGLAKLTHIESGEGESHLPTMTGTSPGVVLGTVGYMSPEQASGEPIDFRSDQFSFGSILYEMATGKRAFQRKTAVDTLGAILNTEPEPIVSLNPQVPAPLRWIVERCLAKEPRQRYASTEDLARDLAMVRDHLSETSGSTEMPTAGRKRLKLVPAASVATLALGLIAGKLLWKAPATSFPRFQQLTFREEQIQQARFAPDGQTIVYGVLREGKPCELFSTRVGSRESRAMGLNANIYSISSTGEMALVLGCPLLATLAQAPLAGGAPREILEGVHSAAWSPDGKSLAVVHRVGGKSRLEFPIGTVLFESTGWLGVLKFAREGDRILFANDEALMVADLNAKQVKTLRERGSLGWFAWSPRGDEIWMIHQSGATSELRAFKPGGSERLIAALPGTFLLQDVAPNGRVLVERLAEQTEMRALAPGQARETRLSWLGASYPADISPDGKTVLFTEALYMDPQPSVYLRKTDSSDAVRLGEGDALALSPDAKWALARRGADTILLPTGAGEARKITTGGVTFEGGATFFPNGKRVLLTGRVGDTKRLYVWDVGGGEARPVTPDGVFLGDGQHHTVSPDSKFVAAMDAKETWSIYPLEGQTAVRPIAGLLAGEKPIRWSANGRTLFVLADSGALSQLDPSSGRRVLSIELPARSTAHITPDGSSYVYGRTGYFTHLMLIEGLR
jgi:Tol biopolymer transport system component